MPFFIGALGRSKVLYLGIFLISVCISCFGFVTFIKDNTVMVIVAMVLRAIQGFSRQLTSVICSSLLIILEPEQRIRYMGFNDAAKSIGDCLGPIIGSVLYELVGFLYLFIILGCFHFIYIPLLILYMSKNIDSEETTNLLNSNEEVSTESEIGFCKLISYRLIFL